MDQRTPGGDALDEAAKAGAHRTQRAGAVLRAGGGRPRPRRELYGFPETDRGEFCLGPRRSGLGLFADLARGRADGAAGRPAVRPLRTAPRLFARAAAARRLVPGRLARAGAVAIPALDRTVRRHRHRADRRGAEFDPARPLVRTAIADRDGDPLFGDRRRHPGAAAGLAGADRPDRLARRLSVVRHRRAVPAGAAAADAVATVRDRLAACRQEDRHRLRRQWLDAEERDAPPHLLGVVLDLLFHRGRRCTRSQRRSWRI